MRELKTLTCVAGMGLTMASPQAMAQEPPLVAAFTRQLAEQCGPLPTGVAAPVIADRIDLDGDGRIDWVVDAARYPCPGRPALAQGGLVTVFRAMENGHAVPIFQRAGFGSRLQRNNAGEREVWVTLGGADCDAAEASARCERRLVWRHGEQRPDLAPATRPTAPAEKRGAALRP
ncbi:MAG: hypothetical protein U1C74_10770 [Phenylobacterium sp.]|nr:hypothetical protein [Phenylobacterium sp.]